MTKPSLSDWLPIALAGLSSTMIGLGIARFAYVPLLPLLIDAHWAAPAAAAQFAAANLIGYLAGALSAHALSLRLGAARAARGAMVAVLLSLIGCALYHGWAWFWLLRFLAGAAGGVLMIVAAPFVMARVPVSARGRTAGAVFSGIGVGIVISGFGVPAFGAHHLAAAWLGLAGFVAIGMLIAWPRFASGVQEARHATAATVANAANRGVNSTVNSATESAAETAASGAAPSSPSRARTDWRSLLPRGALLALLLAYSLDGIGYLPHTVFWVEYLVHGLGQPIALAGAFWALFGVGAAVGPVFTGFAADRFGMRGTLVVLFGLKAFAVMLPLVSHAMPALFASSFLVGALTPGMVAVVSGRLIEIVGPAGHQRSWALLTFTYAILQAAGGYAMAALFGALHSFPVLFATGGAALLLSTAIAFIGARLPHPSVPVAAGTSRP